MSASNSNAKGGNNSHMNSNLENIVSSMAEAIRGEVNDNWSPAIPGQAPLLRTPFNPNSTANQSLLQQKFDSLSKDHQVLQQDLDVALEIVNKLRTENEGLKDNFETLKASFMQLQQKYTQTSHDYELTSKEKALVEEKLENGLLEWKTIIETKDREIANARAEIMLPQDMELLRLKIIEDMEANNEKKWQTVNLEIEKYRNLYFQSRRELELNLTEIERTRNECNAKLSEVQISHESEIHALESRIFDLQHLVDELNEDDRIKKLSRENIELQAKISSLASELEETRANKENQVHEAEKVTRLNSRIIDEQKAQFSSLESEKTSLFNKCNRLELDLQQTSKQYEQVLEDKGKLSKEIARLVSRQEESAHQFNVESSNLKMIHAKDKANLEQINSSLAQKYEEFKSLYEQNEKTISDMRVRIEEAEKEVYAKVRQAREEEATKFYLLETEKRELEIKLQDFKAKMTEESHFQDSQSKENQILTNRLKDEIRRLDVDLHKQKIVAEKFQDENESLKNQTSKFEDSIKDLTDKNQRLMTQVEALRGKESQLREKIQSLDARIGDATRQNTRIRNELEKERTAFQITIKRLKSVYAKEKDTNLRKIDSLNQNLDQSKKELDSLVTYTKKYKIKYKTKQEVLYNQFNDLRNVNQKQEIEISSLRKALESVSSKTTNELQELNRKHEEFKSFLQKETDHLRTVSTPDILKYAASQPLSQPPPASALPATSSYADANNYASLSMSRTNFAPNPPPNSMSMTDFKNRPSSLPLKIPSKVSVPGQPSMRLNNYVTLTSLRNSASANMEEPRELENELSGSHRLDSVASEDSRMPDFNSIMTPSPTRDLSTTPGLSEPLGSSDGSHNLAAFPLTLKP